MMMFYASGLMDSLPLITLTEPDPPHLGITSNTCRNCGFWPSLGQLTFRSFSELRDQASSRSNSPGYSNLIQAILSPFAFCPKCQSGVTAARIGAAWIGSGWDLKTTAMDPHVSNTEPLQLRLSSLTDLSNYSAARLCFCSFQTSRFSHEQAMKLSRKQSVSTASLSGEQRIPWKREMDGGVGTKMHQESSTAKLNLKAFGTSELLPTPCTLSLSSWLEHVQASMKSNVTKCLVFRACWSDLANQF